MSCSILNAACAILTRTTDLQQWEMGDALEIQIERAWLMLASMAVDRRRTLYLTPSRRVVWSSNDVRASNLLEVGTYDRSITLADLRGDVFHVNESVHQEAQEGGIGGANGTGRYVWGLRPRPP